MVTTWEANALGSLKPLVLMLSTLLSAIGYL